MVNTEKIKLALTEFWRYKDVVLNGGAQNSMRKLRS